MRYLEKSFTIAVTDRNIYRTRKIGILDGVEESIPRPAPRPKHEYLPYGVCCFECGLDRIGCQARYGDIPEEG